MGITAHNEESNIGLLIAQIQEQALQTVVLAEIIVVASGCTDGTEAIVRESASSEPRIKLLVQERREGKASAINLFIREAKEKVLVLCSADLLPATDSVEKLVAPLSDPEIGMTSCRPVPVNDPSTFMGFAAHLLWNLHHHINLTGFKAGEMTAFRKVFERIPYNTAVDEASVEPVVRGQGYRVRYVPESVVNNKGPETIADFLRQRRRIFAGHLEVKKTLGYAVSTMSAFRIAKLLAANIDWRPRQFIWTWFVVSLEAYGRFLGWRDFKNRRDHTVWEIASTTKDVNLKQNVTNNNH